MGANWMDTSSRFHLFLCQQANEGGTHQTDNKSRVAVARLPRVRLTPPPKAAIGNGGEKEGRQGEGCLRLSGRGRVCEAQWIRNPALESLVLEVVGWTTEIGIDEK